MKFFTYPEDVKKKEARIGTQAPEVHLLFKKDVIFDAYNHKLTFQTRFPARAISFDFAYTQTGHTHIMPTAKIIGCNNVENNFPYQCRCT
ncbi:hypothetical protein ACTXT7_002238 [Hymenolepis weldensis]